MAALDNLSLKAHSFQSSDPAEGRIAHYRMTAEVASWWKAARQGRSTPS